MKEQCETSSTELAAGELLATEGQAAPVQAEVEIDGQVFRRTVLPPFTRADARRKHRALLRTPMNDDRYERPHRQGRDGMVDSNAQDRYYDS